MFSTGGIRLQEGVFVHIAQTITSGCHWQPADMLRVQEIQAYSMNPFIFLKDGLLTLKTIPITIFQTALIKKRTLYEHCKRSILHGLKFGDHGLPLIGTCDWNDGMNMVGNQGKGESVWLGFFLFEVLNQFIPIAQARADFEFVELCTEAAKKIQAEY